MYQVSATKIPRIRTDNRSLRKKDITKIFSFGGLNEMSKVLVIATRLCGGISAPDETIGKAGRVEEAYAFGLQKAFSEKTDWKPKRLATKK